MAYKQHNSPFNKSRLGEFVTKYRKPKTVTYDPPPEFDILDKKADGSELVENEDNKKAKDLNDGKGMNDDVLDQIDNYNYADAAQGKAILAQKSKRERKKSIRKMQRAGRMLDRQVNKGEIKEDDPDYLKIKEQAAWLKENKNKLGGLDGAGAIKAANAGLKTKRDLENLNKQIENDPDLIADQKAEDERVQKEVSESLKKLEQEDYDQFMKDNPDAQNYDIGQTLASKGTGMYKQNNMDNKEIKYGVKNLRSKGGAFPMVAPQEQTNSYGTPAPNRAGRGPESNQLTNDPNIAQPTNRVANSTFNTNQKFGNIASDAGAPHNPGTMMPQHKTGYTPAYGQPAKALVGDQDQLPEHLQDAIKNSGPGMYDQDGPASFKSLVSKLQSEGKSKEAATKIAGKVANAKMHGAGSGPTAAQKARFKGTSMHSMDHAHTKITKGNVKSAEKDDAAHIDYLKRDINYDAKHGGSKKQMTDDEKHISKLAGDLKYDNYTKRKYDNTGSALSFEMSAPYKQVKYSHSFSDSPMNMGPFEETDIPMNTKTVAQDQSSIDSVKKRGNTVIAKGTGSMGEKIKMKSKHKKNKTKLSGKF